jgi:hypothetical protein
MSEEPQGINAFLIEKGKCCACDTPLKDSGHVNMVMLSKKAPWKYPIWGNILVEGSLGHALGVVCDECVNEETGQIKHPIKYAIEIQGGEPVAEGILTEKFIIYHDAHDLEDGEPEIPKGAAESMALQMKADMERNKVLNAVTAIMPDDPIAVAYRGAMEDANAKMLRQSAYYLMLINQSYVRGLKDPQDPQHHDFITQLEIAYEMQKPTVIIYDETITDEQRLYVEEVTANLDVRATMTHDFSVQSEDLQEKVRKLLVSFEDHAPPLCRANCPLVDKCPVEYKLRHCDYGKSQEWYNV